MKIVRAKRPCLMEQNFQATALLAQGKLWQVHVSKLNTHYITYNMYVVGYLFLLFLSLKTVDNV